MVTSQPGRPVSHNLPSINELLAAAVRAGASDLHLKTGLPPALRVDGVLHATKYSILKEEDTEQFVREILPLHLREEFEREYEADFAYGEPSLGRFRINVYRQRGGVSVAIRALLTPGKDFKELGLPPVLEQFANAQRGLVLVTGPTGSGKTTTLA
ncbi:MAG: ATPase, T2SS/T4P/T4SS family, partial [Acidimicrobiia bacterium]